VSGSCSSEGS